MRIAYGVMGYGRGHATRALSVLSDLAKNHEIKIFAGGDAFASLWPDWPAVRIPTLGYIYGRRSKTRSTWQTLKRNLPAVLDVMLHGPAFEMICNEIRDFRPDVIISDAEAWTSRAARALNIPLISFDHFGIMVHCRARPPWHQWLGHRIDSAVYRALLGRPDRVVVSSFYHLPPRRAGVVMVGPLLRDEVCRTAAREGDHLLVYLNKGMHQFTPRIEGVLRGAPHPVVLYGTERRDVSGNISFRPASNLPFVEDLASCRAVISTAGNQLVGEAIHFGKPLLVMPEACVEQRLNAAAVARMGIGVSCSLRGLTPARLVDFLSRRDEFVRCMQRFRRDGRREAVEALQTAIQALGAGRCAAPAEVPV
ncbi:MAG: hypothetical protein CHACPFDD_01973 [Phycisphaerae bacterium]|nr:hypothetical protein [Phycisphaerae bacterium]